MAREPRQYCFVDGIASFRMHNGSILPARVCLQDDAPPPAMSPAWEVSLQRMRVLFHPSRVFDSCGR
jgi:hypothetical protein